MKKIMIILSLAILIIPFFPVDQTHAEGVDQKIPGTINNVKQKAIFYAVSEKSGVTFSGANGGADNFFDALRQTNYEMYKDNNPKVTKSGKKPTERLKEVAKEFTQTPKKIRPGVGKIVLSNVAFTFVSDMILNSWQEFAYGLSMGYQVKVFDKWVADNSTGPSFAEIPGVLTVYSQTIPDGSQAYFSYNETSETGTVYTKVFSGGYFKPGTETYKMNWSSDYETITSPKRWLTSILISAKGEHYNRPSKVETASESATISKSQWDRVKSGETPIVALKEPKSLGTLNPPSWNTGNETDLPGFIELEVPITEEGEMDLERQLSPDNPAVNDPTKPPKPLAPDYTVPEGTEEDKKSPILTPKPTPETNPLPEANPLPETSTPTEPTTPPAADDPPTTKPGDTQNRWGQLVTTKFPFSLPWDIGKMISPLMADPKRPSVKVDKEFEVFGSSVPIKFSHNFAWMDDYIVFFRTFILIGFNIFLITGTRRLMGGGQ